MAFVIFYFSPHNSGQPYSVVLQYRPCLSNGFVHASLVVSAVVSLPLCSCKYCCRCLIGIVVPFIPIRVNTSSSLLFLYASTHCHPFYSYTRQHKPKHHTRLEHATLSSALGHHYSVLIVLIKIGKAHHNIHTRNTRLAKPLIVYSYAVMSSAVGPATAAVLFVLHGDEWSTEVRR